jgi:DNA mismatch endonuclease (patch repair protein)
MTRQGRRDTAPEVAARRILHGWGLRYRVDAALPGMRRRADLLFRGARVAVFVDGCFWHGCPEHGTRSRNNADWWAEKLARNVQRDRDTDQRLTEAGWQGGARVGT